MITTRLKADIRTRSHQIFRSVLYTAMALVFVLCASTRSYSESRIKEVKIPEELISSLQYLLTFIGDENPEAFQPNRIENVLDFVNSAATDSVIYHTGKAFGASSAYYAFDIRSSLEHILKLAYHPNIPGYVLTPSSVRLSYWKEQEGRRQPFPALWPLLAKLKDPAVFRGVEYLENTPDLFTGAYYGYELDRTFCLFKYNGRNVMISLSKQKAISDIGKKGFVLGSDDDWDYLYTQHEGLSKPGLGWVRSYMYDSYSVAVYCEADAESPKVRFGIFKWINAGWKNMNFVKNKHIYRGLERFGKTFKTLLEYPFGPPIDEMARFFSQIGDLKDSALKEKTKAYFLGLRHRYPKSKILSTERFSQLFAENGYLAKMKKEEMQSVLALEYMKSLLNKPYTFKDHYSEGVKDKKG